MISWNNLPCELRKYIIRMNTSLRQDHASLLNSTLIAIRLRRRDRICVGCMRNSIFENKPLYRRPSMKLYIRYDNDEQIRIVCECDKHHCDYDMVFIKGGVEMKTMDLLEILRRRSNITTFLKYQGVDETELDILTKILNGNETITISEPRSKRWIRYTYAPENGLIFE